MFIEHLEKLELNGSLGVHGAFEKGVVLVV